MANLKDILLKLGLNLAQGAGEGAFAALSPEAYQQSQISRRHAATLDAENTRQRRSQDFQRELHMLETPAQKAEREFREQQFTSAQAQQQFENQLKLGEGLATGAFKPVGAPGIGAGIGQQEVTPQVPPQSDLLSQLFNLPEKKAIPTLFQNPDAGAPGVLEAGGVRAIPNPAFLRDKKLHINPANTPGLAEYGITSPIEADPSSVLPAVFAAIGRSKTEAEARKRVEAAAKGAEAQIQLLLPDSDSSKKYYQTALKNATTEEEVKGVMQSLLKRQEIPNTVPELAVWISDPRRTPEELKQGKAALALLAEQAKAGRAVSVYAGQEVEPYVQGLAAGALTPAQVPAALRDRVLKEAQSRGLNLVSDLERKELLQGKKAKPILDSITALSEKINTQQGVIAKISGAVERGKAMANLNDDVAEYEALVAGFTPLVARAVGHTGVLTEQDVKSVKVLFPRPEDSKSLRDRKTARLLQVFGGVQQAVADTLTQPIKTGGGSGTPEPDFIVENGRVIRNPRKKR